MSSSCKFSPYVPLSFLILFVIFFLVVLFCSTSCRLKTVPINQIKIRKLYSALIWILSSHKVPSRRDGLHVLFGLTIKSDEKAYSFVNNSSLNSFFSEFNFCYNFVHFILILGTVPLVLFRLFDRFPIFFRETQFLIRFIWK